MVKLEGPSHIREDTGCLFPCTVYKYKVTPVLDVADNNMKENVAYGKKTIAIIAASNREAMRTMVQRHDFPLSGTLVSPN